MYAKFVDDRELGIVKIFHEKIKVLVDGSRCLVAFQTGMIQKTYEFQSSHFIFRRQYQTIYLQNWRKH